MKNYIAFLILYLNIAFGHSQTIFDQQILQPLQNDQLSFEKVYVCTNKSSYLPEDTIWFQTYVGTQKNEPSFTTTNLHVNLLSMEGTIVSAKDIFIENGTGNGQFENLNLAPGTYFIQAYTRNMRNFGTEAFYLQKLKILVTNKELSTKARSNYDIQITPEGGYFVENTSGNAVIKALNNGFGASFSGKIVDENNTVLQKFKSVHLGMAKFELNPQSGKSYTAVLQFKDTVISLRLPDPIKEGLLLNLDNSNEKFLNILLKTNIKTLKSAFNDRFSLLCHQRNQIGAHIPFKHLDSLNAVIILNKNKLREGVHFITLFKNDDPIAQRRFYMERRDARINVDLQEISPTLDSLRYKIKISKNGKPVNAALSATVLSENQERSRREQNIKSAFLLNPFIKEHLENPSYYFDEKNKNRLEHLDIALLSRQNSLKSKTEFLASNNPPKVFEPEVGYTVSGTVKRPFMSNRFALISKEGELVDDVLLNGNNRFKFDNLLLFKSDTLKFAFIEDFKFLKPNGVIIDSIEIDFPVQKMPSKPSALDQKLISNNKKFDGFEQGGNTLDEVLVTLKKRSESYLRRQYLLKKYKPLVWDIGKYYEIPIRENLKDFNNNLMHYLKFYENVTIVHTNSGENYLSVNITKEAFLYIDTKRIASAELPGLHIPMEDIETIMLRPLPRGHRMYQVFTTEDFQNRIKKSYSSHVSLTGYDRAMSYRTPVMKLDKRGKVQEIDWKPNIQTDSNGMAILKIASENKDKTLICRLQGFTNDGYLISETIDIQPQQ